MSFSYKYTWDYYPLFTFKSLTSSDSISGNISITIYPVWYHQITLEWTIPDDWGACTFNVYKSNYRESGYEQLNETPISANYFKDTTTTLDSKFNHDFYIVEAILSTGKRIQSPAKTWENIRNAFVEIRALEVQRREWILLTKFTGVNSYVFKRKTYGARCPNCWSHDLEKITKDNCTICMGTSFTGGYFEGINTLFQYDPSPNKITLGYFGKFEQNELTAWTIAYPELNARDVVYRVHDSAMFLISDLVATELQTVPVRQIAKLTQLDRQSSEYQLLVDNALIPTLYQT
jgi:hypothetical protein